ncbi:MAG: hypothetical protein EP319_11575 [Deltaproteobacteria bacterium]|nr:MAG: hypothetical protein EP319_11575 [Deltaproteobacteria bacterium]
MKTCLFILFFFSTHTFASTDPDVKVWIGNKLEKSNHQIEFDLPWLDVVDEELEFGKNSIILHQVEKAIELLPKVLNSPKFKQGILEYSRRNGDQKFSRNYLWDRKDEKLSNAEILNIIFKGHEHTIPDTYNQMNLNVKMKKCTRFENMVKRKWCKGVIGHTLPKSSKWITVNWQFYRGYKAPQIVNNLVHEWIHLLGFLHGSKKTMGEEITYVAGRLAQNIAEEILAAE